MTKAFDTVNHSILSRKLTSFRVDDNARNWFGNAQSDKVAVSVGVAHGSILGPLMFIIKKNDLPNALDFCNITMYADGTVLYFRN